MHTLRHAAALLQAAGSAERFVPLLRDLGFTARPMPLDPEARTALGVPHQCGQALLFDGPGTLRALAVEMPADGAPLREHTARLAARLAARSPHLLWLVAAAERDGPHSALAVWSAERTPPRVVALVVHRGHVVDSDAETLAALAAAADPAAPDLLVHARWLEVLGRDALGRRFYRALEGVVGALADGAAGHATPAERREIALLYVSRLVFLAFLEAKGWLAGDRDFLARGYARCMAAGGGYHRRVLLPLFFGTLNTPRRRRAPAARALGSLPFLNGGLFARSPVERRCRALSFADAELGLVFGELLTRYRFTAREDGHGWSEAAVDPEMLGKAFESLMAARERRTSGAFYTPQPMVEHVTQCALAQALSGNGATADEARAALAGWAVRETAAAAIRARLTRVRLLDPACGSGAFLVHALERLAALAIHLGDARPVAVVRREVLARSVFGVDVNPTAVWLCELRLWLSVVIESAEDDPARVQPLPNLDRHVRVGDSLAGGDVGNGAAGVAGRAVATLRARYTRATGTRKRTLARALERVEREAAVATLARQVARLVGERRELLTAARERDLFGGRRGLARADGARLCALRSELADARTRLRAVRRGAALPFAFAAHFADVAADGGFTVVVGNPPWVRLHNIPPAARRVLRAGYAVFRDAGWIAGAAHAAAGAGFAAQVDLAALFVERSLRLLAPGGTMALLVPAKLWRSLAGGGVRRLLATNAELAALEDFTEAPAAFDAAVYPSLVVVRRQDGKGLSARGPRRSATAHAESRGPSAESHPLPRAQVVLHRADGAEAWDVPFESLPLDDPASPWLLLPPDVRRAFDRIRSAGVPLARSVLGRPALGVKCGCNDAFLVDVVDFDRPLRDGEEIRFRALGREGSLPAAWLRPLVRGETTLAWHAPVGTTHVVWTHDDGGAPLAELPADVRGWLEPWRARLVRRSDLRPGVPWWALFRTDGARNDRARVVWADIGRVPRAAVLPPGDRRVPLNSCYVVRCPSPGDAHALATLLNSPVAAAWLNALAEPARGGYHRYMGWVAGLLPVPNDWPRGRELLAPLGKRGADGDPPDVEELTSTVLGAYGVPPAAAAPLLAWRAR